MTRIAWVARVFIMILSIECSQRASAGITHHCIESRAMVVHTPWLCAGDPTLEFSRLPARDSPWSTEDPDYCSEVEEEAHGPGRRASADVSSPSASSAPSRQSTPDVRTLQPRCTLSRMQRALAHVCRCDRASWSTYLIWILARLRPNPH